MKQKLLHILVLLALLISACSGSAATEVPANTEAPQGTEAPQTTEPSASTSGNATVRIGWSGKPDTLNPAYAFLGESYTIFHLIYNTLTRQATDGSYVGSLAKDWSVSDDGLILQRDFAVLRDFGPVFKPDFG